MGKQRGGAEGCWPLPAACLNSLAVWELRASQQITWPLSMTKVTQIPPAFGPFYTSFPAAF